MNGLRYIRIRCNLTMGELANKLGVTRQALSMWENGKKKIPEQRKEQLVKFFGVEACYLEEITEEEKNCLLGKAMFRYVDNGKETYRYKPWDGTTDLHDTIICFPEDKDISLSEEYARVLRRKEETIDKIEDIIKWRNIFGSIRSEMSCINRGCDIYDMLNELMEVARGMKPLITMPFIYEIHNVLKAMMLAYGMIDSNDLKSLNKEEYHCGEDGKWISNLSKEIRAHWMAEQSFQQEVHEKSRNKIKEIKKGQQNKVVKSVEEQIKEAEIENENFRKEHPELADTTCFTVWGE